MFIPVAASCVLPPSSRQHDTMSGDASSTTSSMCGGDVFGVNYTNVHAAVVHCHFLFAAAVDYGQWMCSPMQYIGWHS